MRWSRTGQRSRGKITSCGGPGLVSVPGVVNGPVLVKQFKTVQWSRIGKRSKERERVTSCGGPGLVNCPGLSTVQDWSMDQVWSMGGGGLCTLSGKICNRSKHDGMPINGATFT